MKKNKIIFLADDDEDDRMLLREAIERVIDEVTIIEAVDGKDLLTQVDHAESYNEPELIIMDMNMPRMSGLEALSAIKSDPRLMHIPVIMISTASNPEMVEKAYVHGINAYMTKPFYFDDYLQMAQAINVCYLNDYSSLKNPAEIKNLKAKNVLVIEDNSDQQRLMGFALKHSMPQVNVIGINDESSTLDFLASGWNQLSSCPQLILLDLYLPNRQDGLKLLEAIKKFLLAQKLTAIPIIVLSHSNHPDDITDCYRNQANAYMVKSPDFNQWHSYFSHLCHFWLDTINLPKVPFCM